MADLRQSARRHNARRADLRRSAQRRSDKVRHIDPPATNDPSTQLLAQIGEHLDHSSKEDPKSDAMHICYDSTRFLVHYPLNFYTVSTHSLQYISGKPVESLELHTDLERSRLVQHIEIVTAKSHLESFQFFESELQQKQIFVAECRVMFPKLRTVTFTGITDCTQSSKTAAWQVDWEAHNGEMFKPLSEVSSMACTAHLPLVQNVVGRYANLHYQKAYMERWRATDFLQMTQNFRRLFKAHDAVRLSFETPKKSVQAASDIYCHFDQVHRHIDSVHEILFASAPYEATLVRRIQDRQKPNTLKLLASLDKIYEPLPAEDARHGYPLLPQDEYAEPLAGHQISLATSACLRDMEHSMPRLLDMSSV